MNKEVTLSELAEKVDRLSELLETFQMPDPVSNGKIGMNISEAAEQVGVSDTTMRMWVTSGYAPSVKVRGSVRISRRALDEWMYQKSIERARLDEC